MKITKGVSNLTIYLNMSLPRKLLPFLLFSFQLNAQNPVFPPIDDDVMGENWASVKFHPVGQPLDMPIMDLHNGALQLSFDDLDADIKRLYYTVQHCDADWKPSKLEQQEYLLGFNEEQITQYNAAFNTLIPYMHYELKLPNENISFTKSGNYTLKIFDDLVNKKPLITRRFILSESLTNVIPKMTLSNVTKYNTHQEFDFQLVAKSYRINNPLIEVKATILQNGRWDKAMSNIAPLFVKGEDILFDYQDKITFSGGKEFRQLDVRSTRMRSERVARLERGNETWDYTLFADLDRSGVPYLFDKDANGNYVIENKDLGQGDVRGEYVNAHFTLKINELDSGDVYVMGSFVDWKLRPFCKMKFNGKAYETDILLKQGFYNYQYVVVPPHEKPDFEVLEGNRYETENEYTIIMYHRPFGARYDRVIAVTKFSSVQK
jgi:Domain of unknown function (DUF5103)